jgi:hypothetical protein
MSTKLFLFCIIAGLTLVRADSEVVPPHHKCNVDVLLRLETYEYPLKTKADGKACNKTNPSQYCSPAFKIVFTPANPKEKVNVTKFGGANTSFANRREFRFPPRLDKNLRNPLKYSLKEWQPYPTINVTLTTNDFALSNMLGNKSFKIDWVKEPARHEFMARWHPILISLLKDQLKLRLSIKVFCHGDHIDCIIKKILVRPGTSSLTKKHMFVAGGEKESTTTNPESSVTKLCTTTPIPTNATAKTTTSAVFAINTTTTILKTTNKTTVTTTQASTTSSPSKLSTGEIVGIAVGALSFVVIIAVVLTAIYIYRHRIFHGYNQMES